MGKSSASATSDVLKLGVLGVAAFAALLAAPPPTRIAAQSPAPDPSLASCPAREQVLRIAGVFSSEEFSSHPVETHFSSTHYARLYLTPLFGSDPYEEKVDGRYGVAESWQLTSGAKGIDIKIRKGVTFNNGEQITARDVAFTFELYQTRFADDQVSAALKAIGVKATVVDDFNLHVDFNKGSATFPQEFSSLVFPLYVASAKAHSNGEISQDTVDKYRALSLASGPYRVVQRQTQQFQILEAARKDPLLGCPKYDRIEFRNLPETGTRMAQFRTGALDVVAGNRDLIDQAKASGAAILEKPATNMIGLYIFQTGAPGNIFGDQRVRLAAAHAIDYNLIAESIWKGTAVQPWGCTWPPSTEISRENPTYEKACGTPFPYDPARAKQLLAEAGFAGKKPPIRLTYWGNYPEESAFAEAIQPMLNEVGFDATIDKIDRTEYARRMKNNGYANSIMFFGPGGRITSLAGSFFAYAGDLGPTQDANVQSALQRAAGAASPEEYMAATSDLARLGHDQAYAPGFFSAGSVFFVRKGLPDWGLARSKGRGPLNVAPLVLDLKP